MLMTYGAGSVGLNLQFASYVFLFDRWWNPAVEDQAINRAHRIGAQAAGDGHAISRRSTRSSSGSTRFWNGSGQLFDAVFNDDIAAPSSRLVARRNLFAVQSRCVRTTKPQPHSGVCAVPMARSWLCCTTAHACAVTKTFAVQIRS